MRRLILTGWGGGSDLARSGLPEIVIPFHFEFEWGPLPYAEKLSAYLAAYTPELGHAEHWSDWVSWPRGAQGRRLSLAEFCEPYDKIELWFGAAPRDQLQLAWLLDHLGSYPALTRKLGLRLLGSDLFFSPDYDFAKSAPHIPVVGVAAEEFETATSAWSAYRAPTPEACMDLLHRDLSALLMLRPALLDLLAELPSPRTGLGATEMRFLEMLARGFANTNGLFHLRSQRRTYVFGEFELGSLLEGLALGPRAAVAGLGDELRTIDPGRVWHEGARTDRSVVRMRLGRTMDGAGAERTITSALAARPLRRRESGIFQARDTSPGPCRGRCRARAIGQDEPADGQAHARPS